MGKPGRRLETSSSTSKQTPAISTAHSANSLPRRMEPVVRASACARVLATIMPFTTGMPESTATL